MYRALYIQKTLKLSVLCVDCHKQNSVLTLLQMQSRVGLWKDSDDQARQLQLFIIPLNSKTLADRFVIMQGRVEAVSNRDCKYIRLWKYAKTTNFPLRLISLPQRSIPVLGCASGNESSEPFPFPEPTTDLPQQWFRNPGTSGFRRGFQTRSS